MSANTRQAAQDARKSVCGDLAILFSTAIAYIVAGKRSASQISVLRDVLQAFKENHPLAVVDNVSEEEAHLPAPYWIEHLDLQPATKQALENFGLRSVSQLTQVREAELLRDSRFNRRKVNEIKATLSRHGLTLKE
jgi:DNA-directed RNA polymerase alpha subunit